MKRKCGGGYNRASLLNARGATSRGQRGETGGITVLLRRFAAVAAVFVASAGLAPAITHADTPAASTLYVTNAPDSNCSDSLALGTQAQPFCTIQAAFDLVNPGQTVAIAAGTYAPATITRSGTSSAPINVVGFWPANARVIQDPYTWIGSSTTKWTGAALTVSSASYVNVTHIGIYGGSAGGVVIDHGSHITLNRTKVLAGQSDVSSPLVDVTGASSAVAVERSKVFATPSTASIEVEGSSTGTVLSGDALMGYNAEPVISVDDAPGTDVVSDTLSPAQCETAISLAGASTQSVIENDVIQRASDPNCPTAPPLVAADPTAAPTATDDYNYLVSAAGPAYGWAGVSYSTPADFSAQTGQGKHDLGSLAPSTSAIDSADSAAPGELPTDMNDQPRVDDPQIGNTGAGPAAYYDRGATETQEPLTINTYRVSAAQAPTGGTVTFNATVTDAWTGNLTYTFNFGDGTNATNTTGTATHAYTATGTFTTSVSVTGADGVPVSRTAPITVVAPAPLVASMALTSAGSMTAVATQQSTDAWNILSFTVDFGDGTTPGTELTPQPALIHSYTKLGTYTVTLTTTDSQGNKASTSQRFTTAGSEYTAYGPVRVLDTRHGTGTGGVVAKLGPNQTLKLKIAGNGAIPANASAVAFNLTVTGPSAGGYLVAYPDGQAKPSTSNLNFIAGQTKATSVIVGVGADGDVGLYNGSGGTVDLVADVSGYFTQNTATGYTPLRPLRILDTRHAVGTGGVTAPIGAGKTFTLSVTAAQDSALPGLTVSAVALNLTAVDEAVGGYVTAYPDGTTRPLTSSLNFDAGRVVPNTVIVPVGSDGKIDFYNGSGGTIDLLADLEGYFSASGADAYVTVAPQRLYDSRTSGGPLSIYKSTIDVQPLGPNPVINSVLSTVGYVYNVTVTQTVGSGYITVYPDDESLPATSNVNFNAGQTTANTAIAAAGTYGPDDDFTVTFTQPGSTTQLIVDLFGYFSAE